MSRPDYRKAGDALDAAIREVDELYYEELGRLVTEHRISVSGATCAENRFLSDSARSWSASSTKRAEA